jgi:hypothetical protein
MPFPLGVDSSVQSSTVAPGSPASSRAGRDSAAVDLMSESNEFNIHRQPGMSSVIDNLRGDSGTELPATVPMTPVGLQRAAPWVGGGLIGFAASALAGLGLYYGVLAPKKLDQPIATAPSSPVMTADKAQAEELARVTKVHQELMDKLNKAGINPDRLASAPPRSTDSANLRQQAQELKASLDKTTAELEATKAEQTKLAAETKSQRDRIVQLNDQLKQVQSQAKPSDDAATIQRLRDARVAAESALKTAEDKLAGLERVQAEQAAKAAAAADERVAAEAARAAAATKRLSDFVKNLNQKLSDANLVASGAKPEELLAGVEAAVRRRPNPTPIFDTLQADRLFASGLRDYRERDYAQAREALAAAVKANERDARIRYILGLALNHLGQSEAATAELRAAAALEQQHSPSPREVDEVLARLPQYDRAVIGRFRP